jgi:hypothetical protein
MQRRAKSDAPGTYDEAGILTTSSLAATNNSPSKNSKDRSSNKSCGVKIITIPVAIFLVILLLLDKFTPTPNVLIPNNERASVQKTASVKASDSLLAQTKAKATATTTTDSTTTKSDSRIRSTKSGSSTGSIGSGSDVTYHIIFSTSCSTFQDWQSYVFFHEALVSGQPGTITRIVSGCKEEEEMAARKVFQEQIEPMAPGGRFKIHFTPDFSHVKPGVKFPYFNKPFGTKHWLENAMGYPNNPIDEDSIVVLMDPDQLIMRPFENNDFSNERWVHLKKGEQPRTRIEHGQPMAQLYGFGLQWKTHVNMTHISPNEHSPVDDLTNAEAQAGYIVSTVLECMLACMHAMRELDVNFRYMHMQTFISPLLLMLWILMLT